MPTPTQLLAQTSNNATINATAASAAINMPTGFNNVEVLYEYTVTPTGTSPTDSMTLQGSMDGTNWVNIGSAIASLTAVAAPVSNFAVFLTVAYPLIRILHTLGGTTPVYAGMYVNVYAY